MSYETEVVDWCRFIPSKIEKKKDHMF